MRHLASHKVNGLNEAIEVHVMDEPGDGGACHEYVVRANIDLAKSLHHTTVIKFQEGPIGEAGVNGLSNEVLLAIVEDRLKGFQSGKFACRENALALTKIQEAMHWLHHRTRDRVQRNVEGTHTP